MAFVSGSLEDMTKYLECAVFVSKEALEPVLTKLAEVKTNRAQYDALAIEYQVGMAKISTSVKVVLLLLIAPSSFLQRNGMLKSLSLLLYLLAKVERCIHSSTAYIPSGAIESLGVDDNLSLSTAAILIFREFSFCLDLVEVAFNHFIFELKILDILDNPVGQEISKEISEEFCTSEPFNLFEWCVRSCRQILKQRFWELEQQVVQRIGQIFKGAAYEDVRNLCEEFREAKTELARLSPQNIAGSTRARS